MTEKCCCAPEDKKTGCLLCGAELVYGEPRELECSLCHRRFTAEAACTNGHYICDQCHTAGAEAALWQLLRDTAEPDPVKTLYRIYDMPSVHMHGPEHHFIVPAVLLAAYKNSGGKLDLFTAFSKAKQRSSKVPGGACGYWGVCGAAAGAGIYGSIITGSAPLNREAWPLPMKLSSRVLARISDIGGVRCCKRTSFIAMEEACAWTEEVTGVKIPCSRPVCQWSGNNKECLGKKCPFRK